MKKTNQKNLLTFIIASMMFSINAHAQIIYTDIPDTTLSPYGHVYQVDLNNDGIADFNIPYSPSQFVAFNAGEHEPMDQQRE